MNIRPMEAAVALGSAAAIAGAATVIHNARTALAPPADPPEVAEAVSVLIPARNEAHRIEPCLRSLIAQRGVPELEILVLDDASTDGTGDLVRTLAAGDPRVRVLAGGEPPPGWKGKPNACAQLGEAARGSVLVFVDADVEFAPHAIAAAVATLRSTGRDLISPFPRQVMGSVAERFYQPMVNWTMLVNMPPRGTAEDPPPTKVANGQFLVFDAAAYHRAGGHGAVRDRVADDLEILRAVLASGGTAAAVDGTRIAWCRMYSGGRELVDGYTKWMWAYVDSPQKVVGAVVGTVLIQLLPPAAALRGSKVGLLGYLAGTAGRVAVARRCGEPPFPHALTHPAACAMSVAMILESWRRRRTNRLSWKGREV